MRTVRSTLLRSLLLAVLTLLPVAAPLAAQDHGPSPDAATRTEILALREKAWRTYFSNDSEGFKAAVPAELLALGWDGGPWEDRAKVLGDMEEFAKTGLKVETLEFPVNIMQQYGDAIILYTKFRLVLRRPDGSTSETVGRGTEIFARRGGKWIHTGWHLDAIAQ